MVQEQERQERQERVTSSPPARRRECACGCDAPIPESSPLTTRWISGHDALVHASPYCWMCGPDTRKRVKPSGQPGSWSPFCSQRCAANWAVGPAVPHYEEMTWCSICQAWAGDMASDIPHGAPVLRRHPELEGRTCPHLWCRGCRRRVWAEGHWDRFHGGENVNAYWIDDPAPGVDSEAAGGEDGGDDGGDDE